MQVISILRIINGPNFLGHAIDVQGYEREVLAGGEHTLRPAVLVEGATTPPRAQGGRVRGGVKCEDRQSLRPCVLVAAAFGIAGPLSTGYTKER